MNYQNLNYWKMGIIFFLMLMAGKAQAQFVQTGKITFERKVNIKMQISAENQDYSWVKSLGVQIPDYQTSYFNLCFHEGESKYSFDKNEQTTSRINMFNRGPARENTVILNHETNQYTAQKDVFETNFIIQDSMPTYVWKIHDEMRMIAGHLCRKATTVMEDSVVIVAFYSDQIIPAGGPESFNGLPGMILGIAIPRLYTTWFATEINILLPNEMDFTPPRRGKKVDLATFEQSIENGLGSKSNWGNFSRWWAKL